MRKVVLANWLSRIKQILLHSGRFFSLQLRQFYPELQTAFTIEKDQSLAWMLSPEWTVLADAIDDWLDTIERNGELLVLRDR
ncbi:MAG: hypothetical protein DRQ59_09165 [Gammaproteobacteria bacterium]|nr:MAG: hypothetical protein DRQ59_09165 [Gammaproteobacteria bacterium]